MRKALLVAVMAAALACLLALAGCAGKGTLASEIIDGTDAYKVVANDAGKGSAVAASGGLVIGEDQVLMLESELTKGSLQLKITNSAGDVVIDEKVSGRVLTTFELDPDDYGIGVACNDDGATGTLIVDAVDYSEIPK
ncbi:MAG: hypothetical protein Q4D34_05760 [Eggerthellaceae bacterium]|nr:hypothetical protein [Eggerthellaceae bacterium]